MEQNSLTKQKVISELSRSPHGKLTEYVSIGRQAITSDGAFFAHLIAWDRKNGQIRDSKVALPIIGIAFEKDAELLDNSFAHVALLGPRELERAYRFALELKVSGQRQKLRRLVGEYLHQKESEKGWNHLAVQHRKTLKGLYALTHTKPGDYANRVLFKGEHPRGSVFEAVAHLKEMSPTEAAGTIMHFKIPFLIALGALGEKAKDTDLALALINAMTPTELTTNAKMLEKMGLKTNPVLRGAFEKAVTKAATSKKNTLKTTQAVDAVEDEGLKDKLRGLQDKQIAAVGGPDGNWLVLTDKSGSMHTAIETGRNVAASLSKFVKGKVHLVFFDTTPHYVDVTGLSLDQIKKATQHFRADGGTSIGVGLNRMLVEKIEVDGIVVVSDGGENTAPLFSDVYKKYAAFVGKDVPVYFYSTEGDRNGFSQSMNAAGIEMQTFDIRGSKIDYYSVANTVATLRSNQYSLVDEIMATPLLSLSDVLRTKDVVTA